MRKKSFLMLIAVLVFSICLTMAFNITAFAADDVAEANPDVTVDIKDDVEETEPESETKEKPQASETILEEDEDNQQIPGQDDADKILISDEKSPDSKPLEEPSEEPEEEKKEEPESLQDSENPAGELHYSVTISDLKGNSVDVTGGTEAVIADVLKDLGYQVAEDAIIEVDTESIDTEVITVTETENGPAIKDNGPFGKACKNLIVYVNGVAIELELVDPSTIYVSSDGDDETGNGSEATPYKTIAKALAQPGVGNTVRLLSDITENITVSSGTEVILDLNGKTLRSVGSNSVITVKGTLTLDDTSSANTGTVTGVTGTYGGVCVYGGTFIMNAGTITGNSASYGGGVEIYYGSFTMNGGTISNNSAVDGGGVDVAHGSFTMNGGTISDNSASGRGNDFDVYNGTATIVNGYVNGTIFKYYQGSLNIIGGTFGEDPSNYLPGGASNWNIDTESESGKYIVTAKNYNSVHIASNGTATGKTTADEFKAAFSTDGTIVMLKDITANVTIDSGKSITLDLNGYVLKGDGVTPSENSKNHSVITNNGVLTLIDSNPEAEHYFTYVDDGAWTLYSGNPAANVINLEDFTLDAVKDASAEKVYYIKVSGGVITGGTGNYYLTDGFGVRYYGGGVYNTGTFTLNGGNITGNTVINNSNRSNNGGGVYSTGTFIMNGGNISGNNVKNGGGGVHSTGTFTLNGGTVSGNTSSSAGGGVHSSGTFTMNGGTVSGNKSTSNGAGVNCAGGTFTMNGGEISGNETATNGGGVSCYGDSVFVMTGGKISGNKAPFNEQNPKYSGIGGGLAIAGATATITGGTISGNTATKIGGGIYVAYTKNSLTVGGTAQITGNTLSSGEASNVYLAINTYDTPNKQHTVTISTETPLASGAEIGITTESGACVFTGSNSANYSEYFFSDNSSYAVINEGSESNQVLKLVKVAAKVVETGVLYETVQAAIDAIGSGTSEETAKSGTVQMIADSQENVAVSQYQNITLDLNGHVLKGDGSISVIINSGNLTLNDSDSSAVHSGEYSTLPNGGVITGGGSFRGGGVYNTGSFTMNGGTISGNSAYDGGGVYSTVSFTMKGGTVSGNTATNFGGGVYIAYGTFTLDGGTISGNTAFNGGGVYVLQSTFTLDSGTISGNTATNFGAGVYIYSGTLDINDGTISGNIATKRGGGVYTYEEACTINIIGGTISGNIATTYECGGVYINKNSTLTMTGGTISGNTSGGYGGGVCNCGSVILGGTTVIQNNTTGTGTKVTNNLQLVTADCQPVAVLDGFSGKIGVTLDCGTGTVTIGSSTDYSAYFTSDNTGYGVHNSGKDSDQHVYIGNPAAQVEETMYLYETVQAAVDAIDATTSRSGNIAMLFDSTENVTIAAGQTITLDLCGKILKASSGTVITNNGTLILTDTIGSGYVTGGEKGVQQNGTMALAGNATVAGNTVNLYLPEGKTVHVDDAYTGIAGVLTEVLPVKNAPVDITDGGNAATMKEHFFYGGDTEAYLLFNDSNDSNTLKLGVPMTKVIKPGGEEAYYGNIQEAIDDYEGNEPLTIELIESPVKENIVVQSGKNIILDLNGNDLEPSDSGKPVISVANGGTLVITSDEPEGGKISSSKSGTGIVNDGSTTIKGNVEVSGNGTGVINNGTMTVSDYAKITGNGTGLDQENGSLTLDGNAEITGNEDSNLYLGEGQIVKPASSFNGSAGITTEQYPTPGQPVPVTGGEEDTDWSGSFFSDDESQFLYDVNDNGKHTLKNGVETAVCNDKLYGSIQDAITEASGEKDIIQMISSSEENINVSGEKEIILDLNSQFLIGNINVEDKSKLTVRDDSERDENGDKHVGGVNGVLSKEGKGKLYLLAGVYTGMSRKEYGKFVPGGYSISTNRDKETMETFEFKVVASSPLVSTTDEGCTAEIEINGDTADVIVVDADGNQVQTTNVTVHRPKELVADGVKTLNIALSETLTVSLDIPSILGDTGSGEILITFIDGIVTVSFDGKVLFTADLNDIADSIAKLVYDGETLKAYDAQGNVLKEFEI